MTRQLEVSAVEIPEQLPEVDDPTRDVHPWTLDADQARIYEAGFLVGYSLAQAEIAQLRTLLAHAEADADRYYAEMCRRPAPHRAPTITYAELCRRRGDNDRAERHEERLNSMFSLHREPDVQRRVG